MNKKLIIAVVGSRSITDYNFVERCIIDTGKQMREKYPDFDEVVIYSGGARGVDKCAEEFARKYHLKCVVEKANWGTGDNFNKRAGYERNIKMAYTLQKARNTTDDYYGYRPDGTEVLCHKDQLYYVCVCRIWDGISSGSASWDQLALRYYLRMFDYRVEPTDKLVTELEPNQVFVFGSNLAGRHGKGAALHAKQHFGAVYGVGVGPQGQCYAIPTKDKDLNTLPLDAISKYLHAFQSYASSHPELEFLLTPVGTGLAGYSIQQIEAILPEFGSNVKKLW